MPSGSHTDNEINFLYTPNQKNWQALHQVIVHGSKQGLAKRGREENISFIKEKLEKF